MTIDKNSLSKDLINLFGAENVIIDEQTLANYGLDIFKEPHHPLMVVKPSSLTQFKRLNFIMRRHNVSSITPRGLGSSVNLGAYANDLIIDLTSLNKKLEIDSNTLLVTADAGISLTYLVTELAKKGYRLPIEPLMNGTLGGFIASGGFGYGAFQYGSILNYLRSLTILLSNGQVIQTTSPNAPVYCRGYNLNSILCGSEGYLGIIAEVAFEIIPLPSNSLTLMFEYEGNKLLELIPQLFQLSTINNLSLFKPLNQEKLSTINLVLRLEGNQLSIEEDFSKLKLYAKKNEILINVSNEFWENRPQNPSQMTPSCTINELIIPTKNLLQLLKFCMIFGEISLFGLFLNTNKILIYIFLAKDISPSRKAEILEKFTEQLKEFEAYPPTLENNLVGFVKNFYPNLSLIKKIKPVFDELNRLKYGKLDD